MIKLPELPQPTRMSSDQAFMGYTDEAMQAYALQAIREFVEQHEVVAWMTGDARVATDGTKQTGMANASEIKFRIPLIIKPELDDADL